MLCFQSKVGPAKWLEPSFLATLEKLGHEGVKEAMVVPISFVTEHIETLHEINIDGRADAKKSGITRFRMMPAVGDSPAFIGALQDLVLRAVEVPATPRATATTSSTA
jgi:ferrochelatase